MLRELRVKNFAVIEDVTVTFGTGLNILTGETGAGKSLLIDALLLLLGARAQADLIRSGAEAATVEATFELQPQSAAAHLLSELGYAMSDREVIVRRELSRGGRHRAFVNDSPSTVNFLERFGALTVEIHGQHEHQQLLQPVRQLELLDRFADLTDEREDLGKKVRQWTAARQELDSLRTKDRERAQKEDLYALQLKEIDGATLNPGEDDLLRQERRRLQHAHQLTEGLNQVLLHLSDDSRSALASVTRAETALRDLSKIDPDLGHPIRDLDAGRIHLEEALAEVRRLRDRISVEPERLMEIDARLDEIAKLKRKYGDSIEAVLTYRGTIQDELQELARNDEAIREGEKTIERLGREIGEGALRLSARRESAAKRFEALVEKELRQLGMEMARFSVGLGREPARPGEPEAGEWKVGPRGADQVELLFSNTAGEPPRPLNRVASGGELSRVALGLKTILAASDETPVVIFDEVDSGVGGRVAHAVGQKLQRVSGSRQVICVTHLAQIASFADRHLKIEKVGRRGKSRTEVALLDTAGKIEELSRMLGGEKITETTRRHAKEMLGTSKEIEEG